MMMGKMFIQKNNIPCKLNLKALCEHFGICIPDQLHRADIDTLLCSQLYHILKKKGISNQRTDLQTLYQDKDIIKHLGAKWDAGQKKWYIYDSDPFSFYVKKLFTR
jgi:DNA polymerase III epsilon subunit-like protein